MFKTVSEIIRNDEKSSLLLVDIGAMGFQKELNDIPERAMNIGIFEDGIIGVAAGMALRGMIPIVYGIAPFIVQRALEQLKLDFAYQKLGGNFLTTGAAYDFSTLGYSHYCPEDIGILKMIPGFEFIAPGSSREFDTLFRSTYENGNPTYFRLSDYVNTNVCDVEFGKATIIKQGTQATVVAISTMLDIVIEACKDMDVTILYYTTLMPFDGRTLAENCPSGKILLCEPHYYGSLTQDIVDALHPNSIKIDYVGIPRVIIRNYGTKIEKDEHFGLTSENISRKLEKLINS